MIKASFVYLSIFTFSNVMIFFYLHGAVERYKKEKMLPVWVVRARHFLDHLDENTKEYKAKEVREIATETPSLFDFFSETKFDKDKTPSSMSFLQIKPFKKDGQLYDYRDDFEYKMSTKSEDDYMEKYTDETGKQLVDASTITEMNKSRSSQADEAVNFSNIEDELNDDDEQDDKADDGDGNDFKKKFKHLDKKYKNKT